MPAFGIGALLFVIVQAVVAWFVSRAVSGRHWSFRALAVVSTFVFGIVGAFVFRSLLLVLLVEAGGFVLYYLGRRDRSATTPQ